MKWFSVIALVITLLTIYGVVHNQHVEEAKARRTSEASMSMEKRSFNAGYAAGGNSTFMALGDSAEIQRRCNEEIVANKYDRKSFYQGFKAGALDRTQKPKNEIPPLPPSSDPN